MHNATVEIFEPGSSASTTTAWSPHIDDRIAFVPRYRQVVRPVPGRLANPVWVDDPDFELAYHVRRSALPDPARSTSSGAGRPDHVAAAGPRPAALGDVLRRGA
jgi:hypothetical protein